jgi:hypothetical protein
MVVFHVYLGGRYGMAKGIFYAFVALRGAASCTVVIYFLGFAML